MQTLIAKIFTKSSFWLALIIIGAFLVRLYKINNPVADWHSWRQADTVSVTKIFIEDGVKFLFPRYHDISSIQTGYPNPAGYRFVEFPLYNALTAYAYRLLPLFSIEVWCRLISIIASLFSVYFIYWLGTRYISKLGGLLSAFFAAFIPYNIYFSRVILPEPLAVALALAAIVFFVRFIDSQRIYWFIISGIFLSLAVLVKPFTVFMAAPLGYLFIEKYGFLRGIKNPRTLILILVYTNLVFAPFLFWRGWISLYPQGIPFTKWMFNGDHIRFRPAFWRWIFIERLGKLILGIWGLPFFALGVSAIKKRNYFIMIFLIGMLAYVSVFATANVRHDYYQSFLIPAVCLALANGVGYLLKSPGLNRFLSALMLGLSLVLMFISGVYQIKAFYEINHPEIIIAGRAVERLTEKDAWVVAPYNGDTAFLYQTGRWGWPAVDTSFDQLVARGADYYVSVNMGDSDTVYVRNHYQLLEETDQYLIADLRQKKDIK